jgi:hypothetical protein
MNQAQGAPHHTGQGSHRCVSPASRHGLLGHRRQPLRTVDLASGACPVAQTRKWTGRGRAVGLLVLPASNPASATSSPMADIEGRRDSGFPVGALIFCGCARICGRQDVSHRLSSLSRASRRMSTMSSGPAGLLAGAHAGDSVLPRIRTAPLARRRICSGFIQKGFWISLG